MSIRIVLASENDKKNKFAHSVCPYAWCEHKKMIEKNDRKKLKFAHSVFHSRSASIKKMV